MSMSESLRMQLRALLAFAVVTAGCASLRPSTITDKLIAPPLCSQHAVAVSGPWRDRVDAAFDKIYAIATPDLGGVRVQPVAIRTNGPIDPRENGFAICREGARAAITMPEPRLQSLLRRPDPELALGR